MNCPKCQTENPETGKYCRECGERLSSNCPKCGYKNLLDDKYCGQCGQRLGQAGGAEKRPIGIESERKPVTALFSDVSGYTTMTETLDPEGEVDLEKGTHGIIGDTVNLASRLQGLAKPGEILVCLYTYRQAEGYFTFESLEPTTVRGKTDPVQAYRVLTPKARPAKIHRIFGLRAELTGREVEMAQLADAAERLRKGHGTIMAIYGDAGTGKSRLLEEFKATLGLEEIQGYEGHAFPYSQNIPYAPLINLLSRAFQIEDEDPQEKVLAKIESNIRLLVEKKEEIIPYIGSLYAIDFSEIEKIRPDIWKSRLHDSALAMLSSLVKRGPTIICLEDLHWADPSSLDPLRFILSAFHSPALILCVYRPPFSLFPEDQRGSTPNPYEERRLLWLT